ncbi:cytochrome c oxidase subunit 3 [Mycobacterium avium]|uniref:cytochrome c oxidase subunit 3 n=1 Tax=Mycobacterium avium TaxID=1764 RepID=UPI0009C0B124|nr:cytochrome c oxidase subunit 3 [Mycobacterium avium]
MTRNFTAEDDHGAPAAAEHTQIRRIPGEPGIWVFITGDLIVFSLFFVIFAYYRARNVDVFLRSQAELNQFFGLLNTMLMLTASLMVALGVQAARLPARARRVKPRLYAAGSCGVAFVIVKVFEWGEKIRGGISLTTNDFFMYYFMFTGIHLFHVLVALGIMALMLTKARHPEQVGDGLLVLESGGIFWHLVDLLWVVLFALLYLLR